jgi:hypothetical protein
MIGRNTNFLGLAIADDAITCAEVALAGDRRSVRRTATFTFAGGLSLEKPEALGQALASFLRQKRFSASRAVVGLPARWLISIDKQLPPAGEAEASAALRLQAERLAASESGELVFDYAGEPNASAATRVLLLGTLRGRLNRIETMVESAGMSVAAVTSSGLALAASARALDPDTSLLLLSRGGSELVWRDGGTPRMLRHVAISMNGHGPSLAPLGNELRRAVALQSGPQAGDGEVYLVNGFGLAYEQVGELSERLGLRLRPGDGSEILDLPNIPPAEGENGTSPGAFAPAVALAVAGAEPDALPVNFRHSRLAPPPAQRISRRTFWMTVAALVVVTLIVSLYVSVQHRQTELDELNAQLADSKKDAQAAQAVVDRITYGRGFFDTGRPAMLDCLRELSLAFHANDRIWVNNFSLKDTGHGTIAGKAAERQTVLDVVDRLKKNKRFSNVKPGESQTDPRSRDVSFSISFDFNLAQ